MTYDRNIPELRATLRLRLGVTGVVRITKVSPRLASAEGLKQAKVLVFVGPSEVLISGEKSVPQTQPGVFS